MSTVSGVERKKINARFQREWNRNRGGKSLRRARMDRGRNGPQFVRSRLAQECKWSDNDREGMGNGAAMTMKRERRQ